MQSISRLLAVLVASTVVGCVAEVALPEPGAPLGVPPSATPTAPPEPLPQTLRLLSGAEYRETVRDLVGIEVSATIDHRHLAGGYDTGANGTMQEGLFSALVDEVERVAGLAVTETLPARFPCLQQDLDQGCARDVVTALTRQAWRRPATTSEVDEFVAFFAAHTGVVGDARGGLGGVVARLLLSPGLLYRAEIGASTDGDDALVLQASEQATLVSYTLTGAAPDAALLDAVEAAGATLDDETLRAQARRLASTPRGRARVAAMVRHWVKATALDDMTGRPEDFPKLASPAVARGLKDGFDAWVVDVAFGDDGESGSLADLLTSPFAMVNEHTAPLVGVDGVAGDALQRVSLPVGERRGLLTQPGLLAAHGASGEADKDRPVLRGHMIKTRLLCEPIGPPSGISTSDAANSAAGIPGFNEMTTRGQYEAMMEQGASCTACHAQFMPLGFSLGRYDALGRYRTVQRGQEVDASALGVPFLGETRDFADGLALSDALATEPAVAACFAQNVAAFVTGQGSAPSSVALGVALARDDDGRAAIVDTLIEAVVRAATLPRVAVDDGAPTDGGDDTVPPDDDDAPPDVPADDPAELLLASGESLQPSQSKTAHGGALSLAYQADGNVVLSENGTARWTSGTAGGPGHLAVMQGDGNFVVYSQPGVPVFHTGTHGNAAAALFVRRSGILEVRAPDGRVLSAIVPDRSAP